VIFQQAVDPDTARADVRDILGDRRYRADPAPRPFRGPLQWLGDRLATIGRWIADIITAVPWFVWLAVGLVLVALVARGIVTRTRRRRTRPSRARDARVAVAAEDPAALERDADAAEAAGDLERAVRLRFRAGLLRLGDRGAIEYRPSLTTTEVHARLGSDTFDQLAERFDEVTYGGEPAAPPDVAAARAGWRRVVDEGVVREGAVKEPRR
jgi:heme exporter protein D